MLSTCQERLSLYPSVSNLKYSVVNNRDNIVSMGKQVGLKWKSCGDLVLLSVVKCNLCICYRNLDERLSR